MDELLTRLQSIKQSLNEEDLTNERIEALLKEKSKYDYRIEMAEKHNVIYCCYCCSFEKYWLKHEKTKRHHENRWKDK
jgi:hypothetical protein